MALSWYTVQTYSGQESKVVQYIEEFIEAGDLDGMITRAMSPTQDVVKIKDGKKVKTSRRFFPNYVLVEMELGRDSMHFIQNVNGVTGFIGGKSPLPLRPDEVSRILGHADGDSESQQISDVPYEVGDAVKIKEGPFKNFDGVIDEVHPEKGKVKVMVNVFGRPTPVELDFTQVNPIS